MRFRVTVPATSANLGPGFDSLGLALDLSNELLGEVLEGEGSHLLEVIGEGAGELPADERHLLLQTAGWYCSQQGRRLPRLKLCQVNRIPLARGLGSSAAAIVAGLVLGAYLTGRSQDDLLALATRLEGHPDNVAPALMGGLVASAMEGSQVVACPMPLHPCWQLAVAIPSFQLATSESRRVLPQNVSLSHAVFNLSRVGVLLGALREGRSDWLAMASQDRLHQPFRAPLVPGLEEALAAATRAGAAAAFLSGAGPTLAAWVDRRSVDAEEVSRAMVGAFEARGIQARGLSLEVSAAGAACADA